MAIFIFSGKKSVSAEVSFSAISTGITHICRRACLPMYQ